MLQTAPSLKSIRDGQTLYTSDHRVAAESVTAWFLFHFISASGPLGVCQILQYAVVVWPVQRSVWQTCLWNVNLQHTVCHCRGWSPQTLKTLQTGQRGFTSGILILPNLWWPLVTCVHKQSIKADRIKLMWWIIFAQTTSENHLTQLSHLAAEHTASTHLS